MEEPHAWKLYAAQDSDNRKGCCDPGLQRESNQEFQYKTIKAFTIERCGRDDHFVSLHSLRRFFHQQPCSAGRCAFTPSICRIMGTLYERHFYKSLFGNSERFIS